MINRYTEFESRGINFWFEGEEHTFSCKTGRLLTETEEITLFRVSNHDTEIAKQIGHEQEFKLEKDGRLSIDMPGPLHVAVAEAIRIAYRIG